MFRRFVEDYVLAPDGDGTLFTWTLALEPKSALRLPFKALARVLKAGFGRIPADGQKYFATQLSRHLIRCQTEPIARLLRFDRQGAALEQRATDGPACQAAWTQP